MKEGGYILRMIFSFQCSGFDSNEALSSLNRIPLEGAGSHSHPFIHSINIYGLGRVPRQGLESKHTEFCPYGINRLAEEIDSR